VNDGVIASSDVIVVVRDLLKEVQTKNNLESQQAK
jgi:hypothetical protein